jgi:hypothetical protein
MSDATGLYLFMLYFMTLSIFQLRGIESSANRPITNCTGFTEWQPCRKVAIIPLADWKDSGVPQISPVRITCVPSEIRTKNFPNTTRQRHRLSQIGRQLSYIFTVGKKYWARINSRDFNSLKSSTTKHANSAFNILFCLMTQFQLH